jgi:endonuclease G
MTPAADVSFSLDAECECFNMPNIEPQTPQLNRITWEHLEAHVRDWVKSHHRPLYIICGGVLTHIDKTIGKDKVAVPDLFYKIIYDEATNNCVAFLIPNNNPDQNFYIYATNVKNIESSTGLKFFINLPKVKHDFVVNEVNINWFK